MVEKVSELLLFFTLDLIFSVIKIDNAMTYLCDFVSCPLNDNVSICRTIGRKLNANTPNVYFACTLVENIICHFHPWFK